MDINDEAAGTHASDPGREFVITRTFDAPRDLVFKAWTEAGRLSQWWGPKGFKMLSCQIDLRPGGVFHYGMSSPDGREMWGKWTFREIVPPERLIFVASFSDAAANITRHPLAPDWPAEVLSTLTFTEQEGKTTITMRGIPINAAEHERKMFESAFQGMQAGWGGTLDQLAAYLKQA